MDPDQDGKLDRLFAAYRDAMPDVEPSPHFLPGIWQQIEAARPSWIFPLRRFAVRLVAASALAVAILTGSAMLSTPHRAPDAEELGASYVDLLTLASMDEDEGAMWMQAQRGHEQSSQENRGPLSGLGVPRRGRLRHRRLPLLCGQYRAGRFPDRPAHAAGIPRAHGQQAARRAQAHPGADRKLQEIYDYIGDRWIEVRDAMEPEFEAMRKERAERIMAILNAEQQAKYRAILDEKRRQREAAKAAGTCY